MNPDDDVTASSALEPRWSLTTDPDDVAPVTRNSILEPQSEL